jgi:hypothetical protein
VSGADCVPSCCTWDPHNPPPSWRTATAPCSTTGLVYCVGAAGAARLLTLRTHPPWAPASRCPSHLPPAHFCWGGTKLLPSLPSLLLALALLG